MGLVDGDIGPVVGHRRDHPVHSAPCRKMLGFIVNFRSPSSTMTSAMAATFATYACPFSAPPFDPTKT